jgi:PHD/YefM family antitoxin component YafN of YafNO toxin-antitoxin module
MPKIIPIEDLKNTAEVSEMCHATDEPVYITKNGYGDMVIMSIETFEDTASRLKMYQDLLISEQQIKKGEVEDAKESLSTVREKYGLY